MSAIWAAASDANARSRADDSKVWRFGTSPRFSAYRGARINITAIVMTIFLARRSNSICPYHLRR